MSFVAPIPEQTGTTTMHFPEVSLGTLLKVGRNRPNQRFSKLHVIPMAKNQPKMHLFQCPLYKEWGKNCAQFFGWQLLIWLSGGFIEMHCGGF